MRNNNAGTEAAGAAILGCVMMIIALAGNLIFWGGLIWLVLWLLQNFGVL